jgi:hypothetical protein
MEGTHMQSAATIGRLPRSRLGRVVAAGLLLVALVPAPVSATPSPDQCASNRAVQYSAPVPVGLRTVGTHGIQWKIQFTDVLTGDVVVDDQVFNQLTIDPAAPAYPDNVLVRLVRNTTILKGGEVIAVDAMRPTQAALMHAQVSWLTAEPLSAVVAFRYQTARNRWSDYQTVAAGPTVTLCVETNNGIWRKTYGWS